MNLRPYQQAALDGDEVWPGIRPTLSDPEGSRTALLVLPTGCGKTVVFSTLAAEYVARGQRALIVAHRSELLAQARTSVLRASGLSDLEVEVEQADRAASPAARVVVGSVASMRGARLASWPEDHFGLVVVDEAHHVSAPSYQKLLSRFAAAAWLGVTATPDRLDGAAIKQTFETLAYAYDLRSAILDGWLAPLRVFLIQVEGVDLSQCRISMGDLSEDDLGDAMEQASAIRGVVQPALERCGCRPTLVFATRVVHAYRLRDAFNAGKPGSAEVVTGAIGDLERRDILTRFQRREIQYLVNVGVFTEGVDLPLVEAIVMARPTTSRALYAQMAGRGTRQSPGKTDCLLLDVAGNAGRHKLVCGLDILDGAGTLNDDVRARAVKRAMDEPVEIEGALRAAEHDVALERQRELAKAKVQYSMVELHDQLTLLGIAPRPGRWGGKAISPAQLKVLQGAGASHPERLDAGQASEMIEAIQTRRAAGLCTLRQARQLIKRGLRGDIPFDEGKKVMAAIASNGWRTPTWLLSDSRYALPRESSDG